MAIRYNNDDLGFVYLMGKKIDNFDYLYKTEFEICYQIDKDLYLYKSVDKANTSFRILNLNLRRSCNEPIGEVQVTPSNASITFISYYLMHTKELIKVKYDNIEKNWDVRTYINGKEKLTTLNKALNSLKTMDQFGIEIRDRFTTIIDSSKDVFKKEKELKKVLNR